MTEQIYNNIINAIIPFAKATTDTEKRFVVAQEIVDRLFISNCFSVVEMNNFIKNELSSILELSKQETQILLNNYETKRIIIDDKLKIAKMKQALNKIKVEDNQIVRITRKIEVEEICKHLVESKFVYNQKLLFNFIMIDLCNHFKLSNTEKQEILQEVKQWMLEK